MKILIKTNNVQTTLNKLVERVENTLPALNTYIKDVVYPAIMENFFLEGKRVYGWFPLKESYRVWKEQHFPGRKMLYLTGDLQASFRPGGFQNVLINKGQAEIRYGTAVRYARELQYGNEDKNLFPRTFVFVDRKMVKGFKDVLLHHLMRGFTYVR